MDLDKSVLSTDQFIALMDAFDAATAVVDMMMGMEDVAIEGRHVALFRMVFLSMTSARSAFVEMIENAKKAEQG